MQLLRFGGRELSLKVLPIRLPLQSRPVGIVTLKNRTLSRSQSFSLSAFTDL